MTAFTKAVTEKNMSIEDIREQLFLTTDGDDSKREDTLLFTLQELATAIIAIREELKLNHY